MTKAAVEGRGRFDRAADNPLARAIGRVRLPLGAKLIAAFGVVAGLLAIGYALGFLALGRSNTRSEQLRSLQEQTEYEQRLLSDAEQAKQAASFLHSLANPSPTVVDSLALAISRSGATLCYDAIPDSRESGPSCAVGEDAGRAPGKATLTLASIDPPLAHKLFSSLGILSTLNVFHSAPKIADADRVATEFVSDLAALLARTRARTDALVAQSHNSYASSRKLLIGVGAGTLLLVLALGLLLSSAVVVPLRRTEALLEEIGAGDFSGRLQVENRDEIGTLARRANTMSEELQRVHRELELASEHKSQFLANMSHELRTPLNAIIGFSEVLHEQMFGELNERQLAYVEDVLEAGKHLLSLINDVLDLAKIEAGRLELDLTEFAIPDVLRSAVSLHSEQASRGGVELGLNSDPNEIRITGDERRVRQVVFNLVSNAVKFTPPNGRVDISARLDDGHVEVAVADTGPGLSPAEIDLIFKEFEQTATGKQAEGTGLGLPLSRRLVELHGGRLWAESEPGRGSTFRFTLPVRLSPHAGRP